ncbi:class D sortase [bacterium]|nr:class D sortase [bacterium]
MLLAVGIGLAGPPVGRWCRRACLQWQGERTWHRVLAQPDRTGANDPVARLEIMDIGLEQNVLQTATLQHLVQSPAFVEGSGSPMILAHRDTHFRKLQSVRVGMEVQLETVEQVQRFKVTDIEIHTPQSLQQRVAEMSKPDVLLLSTCYPFRYVGPAPERFLVICRSDEATISRAF